MVSRRGDAQLDCCHGVTLQAFSVKINGGEWHPRSDFADDVRTRISGWVRVVSVATETASVVVSSCVSAYAMCCCRLNHSLLGSAHAFRFRQRAIEQCCRHGKGACPTSPLLLPRRPTAPHPRTPRPVPHPLRRHSTRQTMHQRSLGG